MLVKISSGVVAMGHDGAGDKSVGGDSAGIESLEKSAIKSEMVEGGAVSEWCAVFGTVTGAFDGFEFAGFDEGWNVDAGKCFFLYFSCTLASKRNAFRYRLTLSPKFP